MRRIVTAVALAVLLAGCAHHASRHARQMSRVIPRDGGEFDVLTHWKTQDQAEAWALEMADATCYERGQRFVVLSQQVEYKGLVSEQVNRDSDLARRNVPVPLVRNIFIPDLRDRDDYQVGLRCKCEGSASPPPT